ncbi:MAG: hypothetical protein IJ174_01580 [Clostridia bacterium]|nr:hypothetical protein [Clostridia bacterium]
MKPDKDSFILGMITAFCECVAAGCKRMALSPPLTPDDYARIRADAESIIEKHGLLHFHERNEELSEGTRFEWIIIAAKPQTLAQYQRLRGQGLSPAKSLSPFADLLSYNEAESVHTGYDAYRAFFTPE